MMPRPAPRPWPGDSLRRRLLLAVLAWVTLGIAGIWYSATGVFTRHVERQYHEELAVHIKELGGLMRVGANGTVWLDRPLSDPRYGVPLSGFYWQIAVEGGRTLRSVSLTRGSLNPAVASSPQVRHRIDRGPTGPAITYGYTARGPSGQTIHLVIATDQRLLDETLAGFTRELTVWLAGLAVALLATGLAVAVFGFHPLNHLASEISRLRSGRGNRLEGRYPAEIRPLVSDLNAYITHNAAIVDKGRVEAGALAHALRTPLAVITDEAERLARSADTAPHAAVFLDQARVMGQQIEYRLAKARSAMAAGVPGSVSRIDEVLGPILSAMARLYPAIRFEYEDDGAGDAGSGAVLPVDPVDLAELLSNLLDNAGKWAKSAVGITVTGSAAPTIAIVDDGPGMTAEQLVEAFAIGARFDETRPGSGLGLAIARDLAASYGLDITLSPRPDGSSGLMVRIVAAPTE